MPTPTQYTQSATRLANSERSLDRPHAPTRPGHGHVGEPSSGRTQQIPLPPANDRVGLTAVDCPKENRRTPRPQACDPGRRREHSARIRTHACVVAPLARYNQYNHYIIMITSNYTARGFLSFIHPFHSFQTLRDLPIAPLATDRAKHRRAQGVDPVYSAKEERRRPLQPAPQAAYITACRRLWHDTPPPPPPTPP